MLEGIFLKFQTKIENKCPYPSSIFINMLFFNLECSMGLNIVIGMVIRSAKTAIIVCWQEPEDEFVDPEKMTASPDLLARWKGFMLDKIVAVRVHVALPLTPEVV
jgi:hypothetical protein